MWLTSIVLKNPLQNIQLVLLTPTYTQKVLMMLLKKHAANVEGYRNELSLLNKLAVSRGDVAITDLKVMFYRTK